MSADAPTPYADINAVLHDFQRQIAAILGSQMISMYIYGSLALGDFDPATSDLDFIVITDGGISVERFAALQTMHARFTASDSAWASMLEAAYIPQQILDPAISTDRLYPQLEHDDGQLKWMPREIGWAFQAETLREYGITVSGADPKTLMPPVTRRDLYQAAYVIAAGWLEQSKSDPSWIAWVSQRDAQSFVVLTLCRFLYLLDQGRLASKPAAGRWGQSALPEQYRGLIERSLQGKHDPRPTSKADLTKTLRLLRYTVKQVRAALSSAG